ncbi:hypothetical protein D3C85_1267640 [compost metagenome]
MVISIELKRTVKSILPLKNPKEAIYNGHLMKLLKVCWQQIKCVRQWLKEVKILVGVLFMWLCVMLCTVERFSYKNIKMRKRILYKASMSL